MGGCLHLWLVTCAALLRVVWAKRRCRFCRFRSVGARHPTAFRAASKPSPATLKPPKTSTRSLRIESMEYGTTAGAADFVLPLPSSCEPAMSPGLQGLGLRDSSLGFQKGLLGAFAEWVSIAREELASPSPDLQVARPRQQRLLGALSKMQAGSSRRCCINLRCWRLWSCRLGWPSWT